MRLGLWALGAAWLAAVALAGCKGEAKQEVEAQGVRVSLTAPARRDVPVTTEVVGRLAQSRFTTLGAELAGRVVAVHVEAGDPVRKGQVLVQLDDRDARAAVVRASSRLAGLRARLAVQRKMVKRYRSLLRERFVTQTQLDEAEAGLTDLEKRLRAARADLAQARRNVARARVTAPFDGRVQRRFVAPGDFIGRGKPLVSLAATGATGVLHATLPFPETMAGRIHAGLPVRLRALAACPAGRGELESRIREVSPQVSARDGAFEARVDLPAGLDAACWRPGGSVAAAVRLAVHRAAWVLPEAAVVLRPAGSVVYVIADGVARQRKVRVGERLDGVVEIVEGLRGDERVALDGAGWLSDGARVAVVGGDGA